MAPKRRIILSTIGIAIHVVIMLSVSHVQLHLLQAPGYINVPFVRKQHCGALSIAPRTNSEADIAASITRSCMLPVTFVLLHASRNHLPPRLPIPNSVYCHGMHVVKRNARTRFVLAVNVVPFVRISVSCALPVGIPRANHALYARKCLHERS